MENSHTDKTKQLLAAVQSLGRSSEETTRTVQKIKTINESLVKTTQQQYQVVNDVFADGEHIQQVMDRSVNKAKISLTVLNETVATIENDFNRIEDSIHHFDKIQESTQALFKVARHTKMLALNTAVLGGSLGSDGSSNGINIVAQEMQGLVKTCEEASQHIDAVVASARENVKKIIAENKLHMQAGRENTANVEAALQTLIYVFNGSENANPAQREASVRSIVASVSDIEKIAQQVTQIAEDTNAETQTLNNEVEVSNRVLSDLVGIVTNTPITNIAPEAALNRLQEFRIIDVRRPDEFNDQLGHISGAKLCTINESSFKKTLVALNTAKTYLFVCRSGGRSSRAARIAQTLGFSHIYNLEGGMLAWNKCTLPVVRS
jgi:rhodanese-related sulfurtransferase